jgi:hypothetical protein
MTVIAIAIALVLVASLIVGAWTICHTVLGWIL